MAVRADQIVTVSLPDDEVQEAISIAARIADSIADRADLHSRDYLERFVDCLMGELAERMVIGWLTSNGKYATSAIDKNAPNPDPGHDMWLKNNAGGQIKGSVKSSISLEKSNPSDILRTFTLASSPAEVRDVNIQVYFWLVTRSTPRVGVPSLRNSAIFAWAPGGELGAGSFAPYRGEARMAPRRHLADLHPMEELLAQLS